MNRKPTEAVSSEEMGASEMDGRTCFPRLPTDNFQDGGCTGIRVGDMTSYYDDKYALSVIMFRCILDSNLSYLTMKGYSSIWLSQLIIWKEKKTQVNCKVWAITTRCSTPLLVACLKTPDLGVRRQSNDSIIPGQIVPSHYH